MHINLYLIPFVVILGLLFSSHDNPKNRKWFIIICSSVLVFIAAMRSPEFMTSAYHLDTLNYKVSFEKSFDLNWGEFWSAVVGRYIGLNDEFDIGFVGLEKILGFITHDFHIFSFLADLIFFIPFGIMLYRYCNSIKQLVFVFVFYIAMVQIFFMSGARQLFALGFDIMALLSIMNRKRLRSFVFFILGISIHFSSILFAIPLLMLWFGLSYRALKILHVVCFIMIPIVLLMPNEIISFMGNVVGMERYANYGERSIEGGGTTFIMLIEMLSLFCLVSIKKVNMNEFKALKAFYVMAPLFTFFAPLVISNGTMIRISLYYHLFLSLLVPYGIDSMFKGRDRTLIYIVAIGVLAFLSVSDGGLTYYFFWQV